MRKYQPFSPAEKGTATNHWLTVGVRNSNEKSGMFLTVRMINHWNNPVMEMADFPSLDDFKSRLDAFLEDVVKSNTS